MSEQKWYMLPYKILLVIGIWFLVGLFYWWSGFFSEKMLVVLCLFALWQIGQVITYDLSR